jgi:hypothetical protein
MRPVSDNPYEAAAREQKAAAIATLLAAKHVTAQDAEEMDDAGWNAATALAGQRLPASPETRARVVDLLRAIERHATSDVVFEGLPT